MLLAANEDPRWLTMPKQYRFIYNLLTVTTRTKTECRWFPALARNSDVRVLVWHLYKSFQLPVVAIWL